MIWTNDPVRDFQRYDAECEDAEARRDYIVCDKCGGKIYREDEMYEGDHFYEVEGQNICEDCIENWLEDRRLRLT